MTAPTIPERIGPYRIQRQLGEGGMATVYAAMQEQPRRTVAVKVMRDLPEPDRALRRFRREIEILGKLRHQYIAQVFEAGMHEDGLRRVPYYVMEYVAGSKTIIEHVDEKRLELRDRLKIFVKICAAVEHGHRARVIHRDLKPANILVDQKGDPKIIDFGIARGMDRDAPGHTRMSDDGHLVGTLQYMAPEQLNADPIDIDARCDVYALGALLYRMTTMKRHHDLSGLPLMRAAQIVQEEDPIAPSRLNPELKGDLETIIMKALERDPGRRYMNAGSLGRDLVRFLGDKPINARRAGIVHRSRLFARRHRAAVIGGVISVTILFAAGAGLVIQHMVLTSGEGNGESDGGNSGTTNGGTGGDGTPTIATPGDSRESYLLAREGAMATALSFNASGSHLALTAADGSTTMFDMASRARLASTHDHDGIPTVCLPSHDGALLITTAEDGQIVVVKATSGEVVSRVRQRFGSTLGFAAAPDGAAFAVSTDDLLIRLLDSDGRETRALRGTRGGFGALAYSADGTLIAGAGERGDVFVWRTETAEQVALLEGLAGPASWITLTPGTDGPGVIAITATGDGRMWSHLDSRSPVRFTVPDPAHAAFGPGGWIVTRSTEGFQRIDPADPSNAQSLVTFAVDPDAAVAVTPDGQWIAAGQRDGTVKLIPLVVRPPAP